MKVGSVPGFAPFNVQQPEFVQNERSGERTGTVDNEQAVPAPVSSPDQSDGTCQIGSDMSTQDFLSLRVQSASGDFGELDAAISRLSEEVEESAKLVDTLRKLMELTDPKKVDLKILEKMVEVMDELAGSRGDR